MKYSCDLIEDLLPLYQDNVCNNTSRNIVEEHLKDCEKCNVTLKRLRNTTYETNLQSEKEDVVRRYAKNVKKKTFIVGGVLASILAIPILVCLIVNLAAGHALDWFFIVLFSLLLLSSITVVPLMLQEKKALWTITSFTISLLLLLLTCCIYTGGSWFFIAGTSILFGMSVFFLPVVLKQLPLKGFFSNNKGLLAMIIDSVLLYGIIFFSLSYGQTAVFLHPAYLIAAVNILYPWGLFLTIRYLKYNGLMKAGICTLISGFFFAFSTDIINSILGYKTVSIMDCNLRVWNDKTINANVYVIILIVGIVAGIAFIAAGYVYSKNRSSNNKNK